MEQKNIQKLPNSTGALVLGILSIVFAFCYSIPGMIMGIIAIVLANKANKIYQENPSVYDGYGNVKAGKIMGIIGLSLSVLYLVVIIILLVTVGSLGALMLGEMFGGSGMSF